jgi:hypothetical protein
VVVQQRQQQLQASVLHLRLVQGQTPQCAAAAHWLRGAVLLPLAAAAAADLCCQWQMYQI